MIIFKSTILTQVRNSPMNVFLASLAMADILVGAVVVPFSLTQVGINNMYEQAGAELCQAQTQLDYIKLG